MADKVHENQMKIKRLETGQTRLETGQTQLIAAQTTAATALSNLQAKLDGLVQHQTYTPAFAQQNHQQPVRRFQAPLQGNQLGQYQQYHQNPMNQQFRPQQPQQKQQQQPQQRLQVNPRPQNAVPAAAVETGELEAEELGAYEGDRRLLIGLANLLSVADLAGVDLDEEHLTAGVEQMNFY